MINMGPSTYYNEFLKYMRLSRKNFSSFSDVLNDVNENMEPFPEETKANAVIVLGYSGNGKTTYISNFMRENGNYAVVSMDEVVEELAEQYDHFEDGDIIEYFGRMINAYSLLGKNIIIDGNFLNLFTRTALTDTLRTFKYNINAVDLTPNINNVLPFRIRDEVSKELGVKVTPENEKEYIDNPIYKSVYKKIMDYHENEKKNSFFELQVENNALLVGLNNLYSYETNMKEIGNNNKKQY